MTPLLEHLNAKGYFILVHPHALEEHMYFLSYFAEELDKKTEDLYSIFKVIGTVLTSSEMPKDAFAVVAHDDKEVSSIHAFQWIDGKMTAKGTATINCTLKNFDTARDSKHLLIDAASVIDAVVKKFKELI